jgi:hypothetical protein
MLANKRGSPPLPPLPEDSQPATPVGPVSPPMSPASPVAPVFPATLPLPDSPTSPMSPVSPTSPTSPTSIVSPESPKIGEFSHTQGFEVPFPLAKSMEQLTSPSSSKSGSATNVGYLSPHADKPYYNDRLSRPTIKSVEFKSETDHK